MISYVIVIYVVSFVTNVIAVSLACAFADAGFSVNAAIGTVLIAVPALIQFATLLSIALAFIFPRRTRQDDDTELCSCLPPVVLELLRGSLLPIVTLVGVGFLIAGVTSADHGTGLGVAAIIVGVAAACTEVILTCAGVAKAMGVDFKDCFSKLLGRKSEYATIDS